MTIELVLSLMFAVACATATVILTCRMPQPRVRRRYIKAKPRKLKSQ
jgi:hypothetical protein